MEVEILISQCLWSNLLWGNYLHKIWRKYTPRHVIILIVILDLKLLARGQSCLFGVPSQNFSQKELIPPDHYKPFFSSSHHTALFAAFEGYLEEPQCLYKADFLCKCDPINNTLRIEKTRKSLLWPAISIHLVLAIYQGYPWANLIEIE